jgi:membrane fusion protein (multidrug efflux system)
MAARKKHFIAIIAGVGLLALGGTAYFANQSSPSPHPPAGTPPGGKPAGGPPGGFSIGVETAKVSASGFQDDVAAVGSLKSNESVVLRPEIAGRIAAIHLREGMPAARGTVLVALDAAMQAAELRQAEANLALSQANFKRTEDLYQKKFVAERARDEAAANLKVLEAAVALAQAKLQKTQIRAPFDGIVGIRNVSVGDYVKEGQELINIEDIGSLKVDFRLPESYLSRLHKGQGVELSADAMPGQTFKGVLDAIDPLLDAAGRAISLRARLDNPERKLRPGMFVRVRLAFGGERQGLAVPEEALVPAGSDNFVFRVAEGKAQRVMVKIGQRRGAAAEIVEGLKAGDEVVTAGQLKLRDGVPVKAVQAGGPPAAAKPEQK